MLAVNTIYGGSGLLHGGNLAISSGHTSLKGFSSGNISLLTPTDEISQRTGSISIRTGDAIKGTAGTIKVSAGLSSSSGHGSDVIIKGGRANSILSTDPAAGGSVYVKGGKAYGGGGNVKINGGTAQERLRR